MRNGIHFEKKNLGVLSPLESDIMNVLWSHGDMRVREVHKKINLKSLPASRRSADVPLTSVAVLLDRLHDKKIVTRTIETGRGGEHYIYSPMLTQQDFHKSVLDQTVDKLIETFGSTAVTYFNQRFKEKKKNKIGG